MIRKFLSAGAATAVVAGLAGPVFAGANDYVFEPVKAEVKKGDDVVVSVRLKHKANGKPVTDAVIIQTRTDMEPDGMGEMTSPLTPVPSNEPGVRRNPARARRSRRRGGRLLVCPPPGPRPRVRCRAGKHRYGSGAQILYYRDPSGAPYFSAEPRKLRACDSKSLPVGSEVDT